MPKMRKMMVSLYTAAALLLTGSAVSPTRNWSYAATAVPSIAASTFNTPINTSSITFAGGSGSATGNSAIVIYNLATVSSENQSTPDTFASVPFNLGLTLSDTKSLGAAGAVTTGTVNFGGRLYSATNVSSQSSLGGSIAWTAPGSGTVLATAAPVVLGSAATGWNSYQVNVVSFTPPGGARPSWLDRSPCDRHLEPRRPRRTGIGGNPPPPTAPEPTSLVLAGLRCPPCSWPVAASRRLPRPSNNQRVG